MGADDWIEGAKEMVIGGLLIDVTQDAWIEAYALGGFVDSIDPTVPALKTGVETMFAIIAIVVVVFGVYLIVRGTKTALTKW